MKRRFYALEGWREIMQNLTRGGFRILAALALALTLLGANPSSLAQAAPAYAHYHFVMIAVPSAAYVCTGESMTFKVSISVQLESQPGDTAPNFGRIRGGWVFSERVSGEGVINPTSNLFTTPEEIAPDSANFSFSAGDSPGTTTLKFESFVSEFWLGAGNYMEEGKPELVSTTANIEVRKCGYKVLMSSQAPVPGIGLWIGSTIEHRLIETTPKHFGFETDWNVFYIDYNLWGCPFTGTITPDTVKYEAHVDKGRLYLDFTIQEFTETITAHCKDGPAPIIYKSPAGTGTVSVPSQGGVATYSTPGGGYLFVITRVSDEETGP